MADNDANLSVGVLIDTSQLGAGVSQVSTQVEAMAAKIKAAFGSIESAPEGVQQAFQMLNAELGRTAPNAANVNSMMNALGESLSGVASKGAAPAEREVSNLSRTLQQGAARLGAYAAGLGQVGFVLGRLAAGSAVAFGAIAAVEVISAIVEQYEKWRQSALLTAEAVHHVTEEEGKQTDELTSLREAYIGITEGPIDEYRQKLADIDGLTVDFSSRTKALTEELQSQSHWWNEIALAVGDYWRLNADIQSGKGLQGAAPQSQSLKDIEEFIRLTNTQINTVHDLGAAYDAVGSKLSEVESAFAARQNIGAGTQDEEAAIRSLQQFASEIYAQMTIEQQKAANDRAQIAKDSLEKQVQDERDADAERAAIERAFGERIKKGMQEQEEMTREMARMEDEIDRRIGAAQDEAARKALEAQHKEESLIGERIAMQNQAATTELATNRQAADERIAQIKDEYADTISTKNQELRAIVAVYEQEKQAAISAIFARIAAEKQFQTTLAAKGGTPQNDPAYEASLRRQQQLYDELARAVAQYNKQIAEAKLQQQTLADVVRTDAKQMTDSFNQGMGNALGNWLRGTESFSYAIRHMFGDMLIQQAQFWAQWLLKQAEAWLASAIFGEQGAVKQSVQNVQIATSDAGVAAANTYAAVSAIPIVGPFIAPAMAAAAMDDVLGYAALASFAEGGIVPNDTLAMVHSQEMVLPADISKGLQGAISGGSFSGKSGGGDIHVHIHAVDAESFGNSQAMNKIKKELSRHARRIGLTKR